MPRGDGQQERKQAKPDPGFAQRYYACRPINKIELI
jgi:hypothetical protein